MNKTVNKVQTHIKNHQKVYFIGGGVACIVIGAVGTLIFVKKFPAIVINDVGNIKVNSPTINQITIEIPKPGNSGNTILCGKDGILYPSQNSLAKAHHVSAGEISKILNGFSPDTYGLDLTKVAENGVALAS